MMNFLFKRNKDSAGALQMRDTLCSEDHFDGYKSHYHAYWYDSHKAKEKLYFGYRAFEIAALMKACRIDTDSLNGVEYFPYELYNY